jgi:MYXO-CTERM domain-containing protein
MNRETGKMNRNTLATWATVALLAIGVTANAAIITPTIAANHAGTFTAFAGNDVNHIVDGSGFTENLSDITLSTHDAGTWITGWFSDGNDVGNPLVDFDLGGTYTVTAAHIWNYNDPNPKNRDNWGVNGFTLIFSSDATFGNGDDTSQSFASLPVADGTNTYTGSHYTLTPVANVAYIRLKSDTNHVPGQTIQALSEVRFSSTVVPEPASLAMGLAGLTLIAARRRRSA